MGAAVAIVLFLLDFALAMIVHDVRAVKCDRLQTTPFFFCAKANGEKKERKTLLFYLNLPT